MGKYISLDQLKDALRFIERSAVRGEEDAVRSVVGAIQNIKFVPADVVPVVRCAECKYWDRSVLEHQANDFREWDEAECGMLAERDPYHETDHYTEEDDFCSRGERKDG